MKILMTGNTAFKLANFRRGLIKRLIADGHDVVALVPEDEYSGQLTDLGCQVIPLHMDRKSTSPITESKLLFEIYRVLRRVRPDICFGYTIKNNIYTGLAGRWLSIPLIPNVTGLGSAFESSGPLSWLVKALYRVAFKKVPVVFFQNDNDQALFQKAGIVPDSRSRLLPGSGVDLDAFPTSPLPGCADAPHFVLIARMLRDKGVAEFVDAARIVTAQYPGASFELVGPVDEGSRVALSRDELENISATSPVRYSGATMKIQPVIDRSDVVVLPSYYREGTPRVLLEAASMGRPIITTDMPGCRDTVIVGHSGLLCPPREAGLLADAMIQMIEMGAAGRQNFGEAARSFCENNFDEQIVVKAYLDALSFANPSGSLSLK